MRIGNRIITMRKVAGQSVEQEIRSVVVDPTREIRPLIARIARSAANDFFEELKEKALDPAHCLGRQHSCGCPEPLCRLVDRCMCAGQHCILACKVCGVQPELCLGLEDDE